MKFPFARLWPLLLLFLFSTALAAGLTVKNARVPEGPPVAPVLAGYLVIENPGEHTVRITGASSPDFAAVEIHEMRMKDGMMEMNRLPSLAIPAGGTVELSPGKLHLMLIKPRHPFRAGDRIPVILKLDDGSQLELSLPVVARENEHHLH